MTHPDQPKPSAEMPIRTNGNLEEIRGKECRAYIDSVDYAERLGVPLRKSSATDFSSGFYKGFIASKAEHEAALVAKDEECKRRLNRNSVDDARASAELLDSLHKRNDNLIDAIKKIEGYAKRLSAPQTYEWRVALEETLLNCINEALAANKGGA